MDHSNTANCSQKYNAGKQNLPFLSDDVDPAYLVHYFIVGRSSPTKNLAGLFHSLLSFPGHIIRLGGLSRGPYQIYEYYLSTKGWVNWSWTKAAHNGKVSLSPSRYISINSGTSLIPSGALQRLPRHVVNKYRKIPAGWGKERKAFVWNFRPWSTIQDSDK